MSQTATAAQSSPQPAADLAADPRWCSVYAKLMRTEGGFSAGGADRGGATNFGVSLRFLRAEALLDPMVAVSFDIDHDGDLDGADIRGMDPLAAEFLAWRCFWDRTGFARLPRPFDAVLFDMGFNAGVTAAIKLLQRTLNAVFRTYLGLAQLTVDGALGPVTIRRLQLALDKGYEPETVDIYRGLAAKFYRDIVASDGRQRQFLEGWLNRAALLGQL